MTNLAIIPARGGSKRIPRKNIRNFLGKPIIAYSIEMALDSGIFNEVMVSTDDEGIAEIAQKKGAKVPFMRSEKNANDFATTTDVLKEVIDGYAKIDRFFNNACCIYPTAPLIKIEHLKEGLNILERAAADSVFPIVAFSYPILRALKMDGNNNVKMVWPEYLNYRSQDLQQSYHDAGQWYWFKPELLNDKMFTSNSKAIILSETEVQDIDTLSDWKLAELKYKLLFER